MCTGEGVLLFHWCCLVLVLVLDVSSLVGHPPVHIVTTITSATNHQTSQPTNQTDQPNHATPHTTQHNTTQHNTAPYHSAAQQTTPHNTPHYTPHHTTPRHATPNAGLEKRFVPYNGGVSDEQLAWMADELRQAAEAGDRVSESECVYALVGGWVGGWAGLGWVSSWVVCLPVCLPLAPSLSFDDLATPA
jgi:hypothetical protein